MPTSKVVVVPDKGMMGILIDTSNLSFDPVGNARDLFLLERICWGLEVRFDKDVWVKIAGVVLVLFVYTLALNFNANNIGKNSRESILY